MRPLIRRCAPLAAAAGLLAAGAPIASVAASPAHRARGRTAESISHVLLISVDGLHETDLEWYVRTHPDSTLAALTRGGREYAHAQTPVPSDSFPGLLAQVTGGDPKVTGVYYDAEYSHELLPPGTTSCSGVAPGTAVTYDESLDHNSNSIDAGQGLGGLPGSILGMSGSPQTLINPAALPVSPVTCTPVYPHQYLEANTVFEVARAHGLRTAWSDKHPAYEILNGPSGTGVQDLFTPEINSPALGYGDGIDWTKDNAATIQYDAYKVQAVVNEIDGYNHSRTEKVGVPAIFGMNFQTVSTAEKLPSSDGLTGGYLPGTRTPGPLLSRALDYIDTELGRMVGELRSQGLASSTALIISAKHGQSPQNPSALTRIDDSTIINGLNADWAASHPGAPPLVAAATDDDAIMMWLSDRSAAAAAFVAHWLMSHPATGNTIGGGSRTLPSSGLEHVYAGAAATHYFGVPLSDTRHPDVWGTVIHGVVYTGGNGKIAEHGGAGSEDRDVALLVYAPGAVGPGRIRSGVETTQIAPTILSLLGLAPEQLKAVRLEHTAVLPGA
jgi:hypothetical protein